MAKAATAPAPEFDLEAMHAHAGDAAQLLKALANERRLQVLCLLAAGERSVGEMQGLLDLGQSALSQHLAVLREEGLDNVFARHARFGEATRRAVRAWGLELLCLDPREYSNVLTAILLPAGGF